MRRTVITDKVVIKRRECGPETCIYSVICLSGLRFEWRKGNTRMNVLSAFRASVVFGIARIEPNLLGAYLTFTQIYRIARKDDMGGVATSHMLLASWHFQSSLSAAFLVYWQLGRHMKRLLDDVFLKHTDDEDPARVRRILRSNFLSNAAVYLTCCFFLLVVAVAQVLTSSRRSFTDIKQTTIFGIPHTWPLYMLLGNLQFLAWFIVLGIYSSVCQVIHHRLLAYTESIKAENTAGGFTPADQIERIPKKHLEHMALVEMIHVADSVFQVYTFAMLATNIPTTIFTLLAFLQRVKASWADALLSVPEVGLCLFQLTALALTPDRIHREVKSPARLLHKNTNLWSPYNEHVYHAASVFLHHCSASDVGISIWGFALMTKSVILTIISLTATYLTVLLQFGTSGKCVNVDPFATNDTLGSI